MENLITPTSPNRFGMHYFPDTRHYRQIDLETWLPELQDLGASWVTLLAPANCTIPEFFLNGLVASGIQPVIHIPIPVDIDIHPGSFEVILSSYARWGIHYITIFDRPNLRTAWARSAWSQSELVERFLDIYLPLATQVLNFGMLPVFPPLEPGGDYWDTAFLRAALRSLQRRNQIPLLDKLVIGAYAFTNQLPLNWGVGGPERWPRTTPYFTPSGSQDQRGFRAFDWYQAILTAELGERPPILLLRAGCRFQDIPTNHPDPHSYHAERNLNIARCLTAPALEQGEATSSDIFWAETEPLDPIPEQVVACNFWLLAANEGHRASPDAWYAADGAPLPLAQAIREWHSKSQPEPGALQDSNLLNETDSTQADNSVHPIAHYLLMPLYAWGAADWELENVRPMIQRFHPTVGYSLAEACLSKRVTIYSKGTIPQVVMDRLHNAGCLVDRLQTDGTILAV